MTLHIKKSYLAATPALSFCATDLFAAQVATDPGDYRPLPAGYNLAILYAQMTDLDKSYADGDRVIGGPTLTKDIGLLRFVHYTEVGGLTVDPQVVIPFGSVNLDLGNAELSASGVGDPLLGATVWFYEDKETKEAFGVTGLLSIPIGEYEEARGGINLGGNRFKLITQAAYISAIANNFSWEIIGEYTIFGKNDDFGGSNIKKEQDGQFGIQTHLNYHMSAATTFSFSYYHDFGAESEVAGVKQNDELNNSRFQLTAQHFLAPDWQAQVQYGRSISVENGFFESDFINLRIVKVF